MAWLLTSRDMARQARDAMFGVPRRAAGFFARLLTKLHLDVATSWLHRTASRLAQPALAVAGRLGKTGMIAAATAVITSPTGRAVVNKTAGLIGRVAVRLLRTAYTGIDRGLRLLGQPGRKTADLLFAGVVSLGGKMASIAAPVVHRVAQLTDPATPQARVLSGIARSYVVHRAVRALISNGFVRLLVDGLILPAVVDSRIVAWLRQQIRTVQVRAVALQEQAIAVPLRPVDATQPVALVEVPVEVREVPTAAGDFEAMPLWVTDIEPVNRAERRAQQRTKHRNPRTQ